VQTLPLVLPKYNFFLPGTQILLYGPCYSSNGAYTITLDNETPVVYNASTNAYSFPQAASVAGACLRYISPPLAPGKLHYVNMANADQGRETNLDWVLVVDNPGGEAISATNHKSNIGAIIGAVVGSVALLLALVALFFVIRRRRHNAKRVTALAGSDGDPDERKGTALDLLSAQSDIPSLSSDAIPNVLVSPSHGSGSQGNERSYRRIEPFELPPIVDGARTGGGKAGSGAEFSLRSLSSDVMQAQQDAPVVSAESPMVVDSTEATPVVAPAPVSSSAPPSSASPDVSQSVAPPATRAPGTSLSQPPQPQAPAAPDLSQISSDVNRILAQLGQIRRQTDSNAAANGGVRSPVDEEDEDSAPVEAPPEYGKHRRV
jgi:hypothetical protein